MLCPLASADPTECVRTAMQFAAGDRPIDVSTGVAHVHRYQLGEGNDVRLVSVLVASAESIPGSSIQTLQEQSFDNPWPLRFILSDGDLNANGGLMYIDRRPGSPLDYEIKRIQKKLKDQGFDPSVDEEKYLNAVRGSTGSWLRSGDPDSLNALTRGEWQSPGSFSLTASAREVWSDIGDKNPSPEVFALGQKKEVSSFENHMCGAGTNMCIHNALMASLVLQDAGVKHRFVTGFGVPSSEPSYRNTGHSIILLEDGRHFDPTWGWTAKGKPHEDYEGWVRFPPFWYVSYDHFPYLKIE